jgi:hypothetical protein
MYVILTSDACLDIFPQNKTSNFAVQLAHQTTLDTDTWEVGLHSITYPFDFKTVGHDCFMLLRYNSDVHELHLPDWHCSTIEDMCNYLNEQLNAKIMGLKNHEYSITPPDSASSGGSRTKRATVVKKTKKPLTITVDATKRIRFSFDTTVVDLGFSERLMEMLGFSDQQRYSLEAFTKRQRLVDELQNATPSRTIPLGSMWILEQEMKRVPSYKYSNGFSQDIFKFTGITGKTFQDTVTLNGLLTIPDVERLIPSDNGNFYSYLRKVEAELQIPEADRAEFDEYDSLSKTSIIYIKALTMYLVLNVIESFTLPDGNLYSNAPSVINPYELMYVYLDIIKPEPFNNLMSPLLEIIKTEGMPGTMTQYRATANIQYKKLDRSNITNMRILIASDQGTPIPFLRGPLVLTLHFRRKPRYF